MYTAAEQLGSISVSKTFLKRKMSNLASTEHVGWINSVLQGFVFHHDFTILVIIKNTISIHTSSWNSRIEIQSTTTQALISTLSMSRRNPETRRSGSSPSSFECMKTPSCSNNTWRKMQYSRKISYGNNGWIYVTFYMLISLSQYTSQQQYLAV